MKAILEFELPVEREEFNAAYYSMDLRLALHDVDQKLRTLLKHGTPNDESAAVAQDCRQIIGEIMAKIEA